MEIKWKLSKGRYIGEPAVLGHAQDLVGSMQQYRKGGGGLPLKTRDELPTNSNRVEFWITMEV